MLGRLLLRLVVVPFGCACAIASGAAVIVLAYWHAVQALLASKSPAQGGELVFVLASVPVLAAVLAVIAVHMFMSAGVGVLISEALAIRSWIFHGANGSLSAWLGWTLTQDLRAAFSFLDSPEIALAAGLAAGLAYWLVAGRTAGFWKPVRSTRPTAAAARP